MSGTLAVDVSSRIDASARGFLGGFTGDNASPNGRTMGDTTTGGSTGRSGGSHGGLGGLGVVSNPNSAGSVYGDPNDPANEPGAGNGTGGGGGGRVAVVYSDASAFTLANVQAAGGSGTANGDAGSVVLQLHP